MPTLIHAPTGDTRPPRMIRRPLSVLVVEDDSDMRSVLVDVLRRGRHAVREACDGDTALTMLTDRGWFPHLPDVFISDIRMPGYDGLEVVELMRRAGILVPTFLMTGFGDPETHRRAAELGVLRVFDKPFDPLELLDALASIRSRSGLTRS